jgi:hypothetical protein
MYKNDLPMAHNLMYEKNHVLSVEMDDSNHG